MIKITNEQLYKIQNKLIDDILGEAWFSKDDNLEDTKSLIYICGVRETIDEIVKRYGSKVELQSDSLNGQIIEVKKEEDDCLNLQLAKNNMKG